MISPLLRLRMEHQLTAAALQKATGISSSTETAIENGYNQTIKVTALRKLKNVFQIDIGQFLEEYHQFYIEKQKENTSK